MRKITDPRNLPYAGAIVQAILFSMAGNRFFDTYGWLAGLGVGTVVNWSMAIASSRISDIAKNRKALAYLSLTGLFCLSPIIICSSLGWSVANFSWSIAADLSILLTGAIAGKSLIPQEQPAKAKAKQSKPAENPAEPAPEPDKPAFVCSCGAPFGSQPALNAHQRKHKQIVGYVASFEPIINEKVTVKSK